MNSNPTNTREPMRVWIGALAFLLPFLSLVTSFGVNLASFLFLASALIFFKPSRDALVRHWPQVRWVVLAFLLHFLFVLACALLRGERLSVQEKPLRMLLSVSALVLVVAVRAPRRALWWGASAGAVAALPFIAWQRLVLHIERPGGFINSITFGDLAMLLGLLSLAGAIDMRDRRRDVLLAGAGALAGLAASVLTGTRGGWASLVLAALVLGRHAGRIDGRRARALLAAGVAVLAAAWFTPALGVQERFAEGVHEARAWYEGGTVWTNVGTRLELWKGAAMLIREHPVLGMSFDACRLRLAEYAQAGRLDPMVLELPHLHNDGLQALATGGVIGFVIWAATLYAPLRFFLRRLAQDTEQRGPQFAVALGGVFVVLGYVGFGLTEVIFWSMKGSLFYALMVFLLMGFCLNAKEKIG
ncbi:O-antigen ligase family protein [Telluria mixta]|uniref:O-antigen ligase family protein n=1 Tax=Telluria mixta TaxID=34071 RepID=A0ABT2BZW6_9BURK|nr:O-antigen ligase family protein [Telluria mixta]MCS0630684.1 O-antigen ligase family protein [Telluria mixta]WEM98690.1 O-antigen ligase family protein [Telluria mixta]